MFLTKSVLLSLIGKDLLASSVFTGGLGITGFAGYLGYLQFANPPKYLNIVRDWTRHIHLMGSTGTGKTTKALEIARETMNHPNRYGLLWIDPNNSPKKKGSKQKRIPSSIELLSLVPEHRKDDVIIIDPTDIYPIGVNLLSLDDEIDDMDIDLLADDMITIYENIFGSRNWGINIEEGIKYATMAVLEYSRQTKESVNILDPYMFMVNIPFRTKVLQKVENHIVKNFWENFRHETRNNTPTKEAIQLMAKLRKPLSSTILLECLCQKESFDLAKAINEKKIIIVKLGGKLGVRNSSLLAGAIFTKFLRLVFSGRVEVEFFQVFCDEMQRYLKVMGKNMESSLAEIRQFNIGLVLIHQFLNQLASSGELKEAIQLCGTKYFYKPVNKIDANMVRELLDIDGTGKVTAPKLLNMAERTCWAVEMKEGTYGKPELQCPLKHYYKDKTVIDFKQMTEEEHKIWKKERGVWVRELLSNSRYKYGKSREDIKKDLNKRFGKKYDGVTYDDFTDLQDLGDGANVDNKPRPTNITVFSEDELSDD